MKKEKNNSNHHVWFAPFQRSECSLTSFKHQLKTVSFQESYHIRVISCTGTLNKFLLLFILCCTEIFAFLATLYNFCGSKVRICLYVLLSSSSSSSSISCHHDRRRYKLCRHYHYHHHCYYHHHHFFPLLMFLPVIIR